VEATLLGVVHAMYRTSCRSVSAAADACYLHN
jgi:hypothetical protein